MNFIFTLPFFFAVFVVRQQLKINIRVCKPCKVACKAFGRIGIYMMNKRNTNVQRPAALAKLFKIIFNGFIANSGKLF